MAISTYVGDTGRPWKYTLKYADGSNPNLTGLQPSAFTVRMLPNGGSAFTAAGACYVIDDANGIVAFQPATSDVATAGSYTLQITVALSGGPQTFPTDTVTIGSKI